MDRAPTAEQLLADAGWLRRLAERLAGTGEADDLVQETWIAAWRRKPDADRPLRPWLAKVMRDTFRMRRRGERRRQLREGRIDESVAAASPADLLEQVQLHKLLAELVLAMDEPFRSTLLARFVEGRSAAEIARATGVPEGTVRWRLHEALARLRVRLDEVNGSRKAWAPAVLAFAGKGIPVAKTTKALALVAALILLLLGGGALWWGLGREDRPTADVVAMGRAAATSGARVDQPPWKADALAVLLANERPPGWFRQEGVKPRRLAGRVLVDGAPANGALVRLEDEASRVGLVVPRVTRTAADGRFDFGIQPATHYELGAYLPGRVATVEQVDLRDPRLRSEDVVVVLEPCVVGIYGKVVDASGGPIVGASLLAQGVIGTESDANGDFEICLDAQDNNPDERRLVVRASGYGTVEMVAPLVGRVRHDFLLTPEATISGHVVNAKGDPVAMANVRVSWDEAAPRPGSEQPATGRAVSDANGRFELAGLAAGRLRLQAFSRGEASASTPIDVGAGGAKDVQLTVVQRGVLRGRVVSGGRPVAGVSVFDRAELPTYQTRGQITFAIQEAVSQEDGTFVLDGLRLGTLSLGTSPYRLRTPTSLQVTGGEQSVELEVEPLGSLAGTVRRHGKGIPHTMVRASGTNRANTRSMETDEAGRFVIEGLDADDYRIWAHSPGAGAFSYLDKRIRVEPGTRAEVDLELRFGASISGSVVDPSGAPVRGAFVKFARAEGDDLSRCTTDAAGRFRCTSMSGGGVYQVEVAGSDASPRPYDFVGPPPPPILLRDGDDHVDDVRLVVDARTLAIKGVVVDRAGEPVADARVFGNAGDSPWASVPTSVTNLRGAFELRDLSPGPYGLQVLGVDGGKTQRDGVVAGSADVRLVLESPSCDESLDAKLGRISRDVPRSISNRPTTRVAWESIELVGWELPSRVRTSEPFELVVIYKVLEPLGRSWKHLVHIDGPKLRQNADHEPLGGRCPTSTWKPGDVIVDRTTVRMDPASDTGKYTVWIGCFGGVPPSWRNLTLTDAPASLRDEHQRFRLTSVDVEK
ncbi:MAG: sigma-70 family RNA polymerase sigma factor [Kofleriaceae bacterium]